MSTNPYEPPKEVEEGPSVLGTVLILAACAVAAWFVGNFIYRNTVFQIDNNPAGLLGLAVGLLAFAVSSPIALAVRSRFF